MSASQVASKAIAGYTFRLVDFEKAADAHVLAVQWDPGANVVYVGFALLAGTLMSVFFFSHQRVWAAITERDDKVLEVIIAGNTNRNHNAFEAKIGKFVEKVRSQPRVAGER
jgi:cytochrome c biogenesis protein ResB